MKFLIPIYIFIIFFVSCSNEKPPEKLSGKTETIEVSYINWACDCPDFIETKYSDSGIEFEQKEKYCIYIEPASNNLKIPEDFYNEQHFKYYLKLTGQYYTDKGVPVTYEKKIVEHPAP